MPAKKTLIEVKNLKKYFVNGEVVTKAIDGLNFTIPQGEFVGIMGPSGSGKSTLMHILGFLDRPTEGDYFFKGINVKDLEDDQMADYRNKEIGFVFQAFNLLPRTTVFENVRLPLIYGKDSKAEQIRKTNKAIKSVGLEHRTKHFSNQLSGGEKQRVAIARALVNEPAVVFADEPTGNLDSKTGGQIMAILQKLSDKGTTIILVTHEQHTAEHAERIIFMRDGLIESDRQVESRYHAEDGDELKK